jgi:thiosulfate/3-mercaptopyruvate sulfurtransferase
MGLKGSTQFLWETFHLSRTLVILLLCVVAVAIFIASTKLEKRFGGLTGPTWYARILHGVAGVVLIVLAVGLFFAPFPKPKDEKGLSAAAAPGTLLSEIVNAEDHIYPMDLADMILSGKQDLMVVDIRPAEAYQKFHIRTAVNIPLHRLATEGAIDLSHAGTIVLYSNGTTHAAQAWLELRHMGRRNAFVLMDGILGFWRECLTPPSLRGIIDPEAARSAQAAFRKRQTFFIEEFQAGKGDESERKAEGFGLGETLPMQAMGLEHHLVSTEWLASRKKDGHLVIIDAREKGSLYTATHIPGALYLGVENLRTTVGGIPSMMVPPGEVAFTLGRLGIDREDTVVVYADRLHDATYIALALERLGHPSYAILHGGFQKWMDEERPQSIDIPTPKPTSYIPAEDTKDFIVTVDGVHQLLGDGSTVIIDVRPEAYYKGVESDEARAGHIPGAVNRPFSYDLVPNQALWKDRDLLTKAYNDLGIEKDRPVVVHCRTGHQASQTYFLLKHLLGFQNVRWMDASWAAWAARHDLPVEKR